jgi:hypothetical protein
MDMTPEYREWVRGEAKRINSDGCSHVLDIHKDCCLEHDLAYYYGRSPQAAFVTRSWSLAAKCSRSSADARFRECNGDLIGLWRWAGVRVGGWNAWRKHRKARP